jgi:hypothetical protein
MGQGMDGLADFAPKSVIVQSHRALCLAKEKCLKREIAIRLAVLALLAAVLAGCTGVRVPEEWQPLLDEVRAFERRIGFTKTTTFIRFSEEQGRVPFCGHVSPLYLPYSYEDPAILWYNVQTERECRAHADGADVYFGTVEALGETGAAVSPEVLDVQLQRFLYLVLHEDCHEQFNFPYGIEEALCNLIAYEGMARFSEEKYGPQAREYKTIQRYAKVEPERTHAVKALYEQLAGLYGRYQRKELSEPALLNERTRVFRKAERVLAWRRGTVNNVGMASEMTYSRHYPLLESVHVALGRDLGRTVDFFRRVDAIKPSPQEFIDTHELASKDSLDFIRGYEAEIAGMIEAALAEPSRR